MSDEASALAVARKRSLRSEALKWFGVIGTAFTIFSNAGSFIDFSKFVEQWTDRWRELITSLVNFIAQLFSVTLDEVTAVILFSVVSCLLVVLSAQRQLTDPWTLPFRVTSAFVAAALSSVYFSFVILGPLASDPRAEPEILQYTLISAGISLAFTTLVFARKSPERDKPLFYIGIIVFTLLLTVGPFTQFGEADWMKDSTLGLVLAILFFGLLSTLVVVMHFVSQPILIAFRSLGILIILISLVGLNLFAKLFERVPDL